ncbi:MAG: hypothetical protein R3F20_12360 [Planctomycetota bacterium]
MMQVPSRQTGAVNIILFIIVLVIALAGWVLWFTVNSDLDEANAARVKSDAAAARVEQQLAAYELGMEGVFNKLGVGVIGRPDPIQAQDVTTWKQETVQPVITRLDFLVSSARSLFKGDESMVKVTNVLDPAQTLIEKLEADARQLKLDLDAARADKAKADSDNDALIAKNRTREQELKTEMDDVRSRAATQVKQASDQTDAVQAQLTSTTEQLDSVQAEARRQISEATLAVNKLDRSVRSWKDQVVVERDHNKPDGQIIEIDAKTGTCYINLGSKHQLRRGTRFKTFGYNKGKVREYHGFITVRDIEYDRALCAVDSDASPKAGDQLLNPYFDAERPQVFYFLGNLPGRFDNQRAQAILRDFGGKVSDTFDVNVDYVVLGDNPDPEAGVGEDADPNWFKATPEYTDSIRWGVEMIRARDLEDFITF